MATRFDTASHVINGTHGTLERNGRPWAEVTECQLKSTKTKEKIARCGHMVPGYKTTEVVNKGSVTFWHVDSDVLLEERGMYDGVEYSHTLVVTVKDPDAVGAERIAVRGVNFDGVTIGDTFFLLGELLDLEGFCEEHGLPYPQETRKYILRPASPDEAGLFFSQDEALARALACVGHLRLDFGHGGTEFWPTWWPHNNDELNVPAFKAELDEVMNELRACGALKDLASMSGYCSTYPSGLLKGGIGDSYGFIAESEGYRYCLRCIPRHGDYNGYLYIFDKRQQELNMAPKQRLGLTEAGRQALRDAADPDRPHTYDWFVIERYGQEGEQFHSATSLTGAIDRYNGLSCDSKRLGVTKDGIATIDLAVTESGEVRLDEGYLDNPRFTGDSVISEAAARLRLSIAGLDHPQQNMTFGGM